MCDGEDLRDATCESLGFVGGTLGCTAHCSLDVSNCESPEVRPAGSATPPLW
ncbi:MAG: hypothetical protein U1F43_16120 [Myxococcota bacterium]